MVTSEGKVPEWFLTPRQPLDEVVEALNNCLYNYRILSVELDTALVNPMRHGYTHMSELAHVTGDSSDPDWFIQIPIGLWVSVRVQPLEFEGKLYSSFIHAEGKHVVVQTPYLYYIRSTRVDYKNYLFTQLDPLGE